MWTCIYVVAQDRKILNVFTSRTIKWDVLAFICSTSWMQRTTYSSSFRLLFFWAVRCNELLQVLEIIASSALPEFVQLFNRFCYLLGVLYNYLIFHSSVHPHIQAPEHQIHDFSNHGSVLYCSVGWSFALSCIVLYLTVDLGTFNIGLTELFL